MPWREARRKRLQKDFTTKLGLSALLGVGLVVVAFVVGSATIAGQNNRNRYLEGKIEEANKAIEEIEDLEAQKEAMLVRKQVIENLQANRDQLANIYYELANHAVDGVVLINMTHKNKILEVQGKATSNSSVAAFMNKIERSPWFDKPELVIIQEEGMGKAKPINIDDPLASRYSYDFTLKMGVKNPNAPEVEEPKPKKPKDDKKGKTK